jgi:hypothetical protein
MSSTSNDISKVLKQFKNMEQDLSVSKALLVSMEERIKHLEDGKTNDSNQENSNYKSSSFLPPFLLDGPKGYKNYLNNFFRNELEGKFSHLPFIQSLR